MKNLFFIFLLLTAHIASAQSYTLQLFYAVPPTSGCNGMAAFDYGPLVHNCALPFIYNSNCYGTSSPMPFMSYSGDTLFLNQICDYPCSFNLVSADGCVGFCEISTPTSLASLNMDVPKIFYRSEDHLLLFSDKLDEASEVVLTDRIGKVVFQSAVGSAHCVTIPALVQGFYFYSIASQGLKGKIFIE